MGVYYFPTLVWHCIYDDEPFASCDLVAFCKPNPSEIPSRGSSRQIKGDADVRAGAIVNIKGPYVSLSTSPCPTTRSGHRQHLVPVTPVTFDDLTVHEMGSCFSLSWPWVIYIYMHVGSRPLKDSDDSFRLSAPVCGHDGVCTTTTLGCLHNTCAIPISAETDRAVVSIAVHALGDLRYSGNVV